MGTAVATTIPPQTPRKTVRYRFRHAWRAIFFLALIPFFEANVFADLLNGWFPGLLLNQYLIKFGAGIIALVPLSTLVEVVTEDLIERFGQFVGGLLHALFSNVAYLVITASTLIEAHALATEHPDESASLVTIVQSSLAGTIVVDILFILGIAIFVGGLRNGRMQFNAEYSNQYAEMLTVAIIALALPSLASSIPISIGLHTQPFQIDSSEASTLSNITAIVLIVAYIGYLGWTVFKFRDIPARPQNPEQTTEDLRGDEFGPFAPQAAVLEENEQRAQLSALQAAETHSREARQQAAHPAEPPDKRARSVRDLVNERIEQERKQSKPKLTAAESEARDERIGLEIWEIGILLLGTAGIVFISEGVATSIRFGILPGVAATGGSGLTPFFIGFIVLPIAANLVELSGTISTALHDRLETGLAVTAGSAIQVALLVAPVLVLISHIIGLDSMNLIFGKFILVIFGLVAYLFQIITVDGETTWLEGLQFISFFAVLVVVAIFANSPLPVTH